MKMDKIKKAEKSDKDCLWQGSTRGYLDALIAQRLEVLEKGLLNVIQNLTEIYSEKRFISCLLNMRDDADLKD